MTLVFLGWLVLVLRLAEGGYPVEVAEEIE